MRKTDSIYGEATEAIRRVAKRGKPFTISDITRYKTVHRSLTALVDRGELRRVQQGERGRKKTIYQLAT